MSHHEWLLFVLYSEMILFNDPEHLRIENEQRHLLEVNSIDHKDNVRPELRINGDRTHTALHRQSVEPQD